MNPSSNSQSPAVAATTLQGHVIEILGPSDDGDDGALRCGHNLAAITLRMGNGLWTTPIAAASGAQATGLRGLRLRLGRQPVRNGGDASDLLLAFTDRGLLGHAQAGSLKPGATILVESQAAQCSDPAVAAAYRQTLATLRAAGFEVHELALLARCQQLVSNPRKGLPVFVLGLLCHLYSLDATLAHERIADLFGRTDAPVIQSNVALCQAGAAWAAAHLSLRFSVPATPPTEPQIVVDGHEAITLGVMASGMDLCTLAPNTLGAAAAQAFSERFEKLGGQLHEAEDDLAACAMALGASYAGKCAVSFTSGTGYALQQPLIDQAARAEMPLVVIQVQGADAEHSSLLATVFGSPGDVPKLVMAASSIEDGFYAVLTARKLAESFGTVVVLLCDAGLARVQQAFPRPPFSTEWLAPPVDRTPVPAGMQPCDWDPATGLSRRLQPGRAGGMHIITGLTHGRDGRPSRETTTTEEALRASRLKLAALQQSLKPPTVFGGADGDLLLIGWGSSQGAIEEAVMRLRAQGLAVSSLHLRFIQPLPPGIGEVLTRFTRAMTIEAEGEAQPSRHSALALLLRAQFLRDIGCWSAARGTPVRPADICHAAQTALQQKEAKA